MMVYRGPPVGGSPWSSRRGSSGVLSLAWVTISKSSLLRLATSPPRCRRLLHLVRMPGRCPLLSMTWLCSCGSIGRFPPPNRFSFSARFSPPNCFHSPKSVSLSRVVFRFRLVFPLSRIVSPSDSFSSSPESFPLCPDWFSFPVRFSYLPGNCPLRIVFPLSRLVFPLSRIVFPLSRIVFLFPNRCQLLELCSVRQVDDTCATPARYLCGTRTNRGVANQASTWHIAISNI